MTVTEGPERGPQMIVFGEDSAKRPEQAMEATKAAVPPNSARRVYLGITKSARK